MPKHGIPQPDDLQLALYMNLDLQRLAAAAGKQWHTQ